VAITGAAIAAKQAGGNPVKRVGAYIKAHWKELLALVLAAIPALFIVFHTGARKAAQQTLTMPPLGTGAPAGDSSTAMSSPAAAVAAPVAAAAAAVTGSNNSGTSVNGYNPISVTAPDKGTVPLPAKKVSMPTPPPAPPTTGRGTRLAAALTAAPPPVPPPVPPVPPAPVRRRLGGPLE